MIAQFSQHWDHNLGYGKLGKAAFHCGQYDIAEPYFAKLRQSENWAHGDDMSFLAEIWVKHGRTVEAQTLLVDSLKCLLEESKTATGSDRKLFEDWFQHHRSTHLRLFPDRGNAGLTKSDIPSTTRP